MSTRLKSETTEVRSGAETVSPLKVTAFGALKLIALSATTPEVQGLAKFVFEELKRIEGERDDLYETLKHVDYLLNELADERTPANVEMTPAEAALVGFRKHTRAALLKASGETK